MTTAITFQQHSLYKSANSTIKKEAVKFNYFTLEKPTSIDELKYIQMQDNLALKTFSSNSEEDILKFIDALADTTHNRRVQDVHPKFNSAERVKYNKKESLEKAQIPVYNPRTKKIEIRERNIARGAPKTEYPFTKKTSLTLIPKSGKVIPYKSGVFKIGLLFNLEKCNTKDEKYFFLFDAWTKHKWWLNVELNSETPTYETIPDQRGSSYNIEKAASKESLLAYSKPELVDIINNREKYLEHFKLLDEKYKGYASFDDAQKKILEEDVTWYNELLVAPSMSSVQAIFYTDENEKSLALLVQREVKARHNIEIPILFFNPENGLNATSFDLA